MYVYDNGQIVLQFDKTTFGGVAGTDLSHRYAWADVVDQLLADEQVHDLGDAGENETLWALADHLGSVRQAVDSAGTARLERVFDAFGNIVAQTHYNASGAAVTAGQAGYIDAAFAFTGRLFDATTGLQNNLHRWYDPTVGRWLSEDPIGFAAGDANMYRYIYNLPVCCADPSGTYPYPGALYYVVQTATRPTPPATPPRNDGLGVLSGWLYDTATENKDNPFVSIPAGMSVGPVWIFDGLSIVLRDAVRDGTENVVNDMTTTDDPIRATFDGIVLTGLVTIGYPTIGVAWWYSDPLGVMKKIWNGSKKLLNLLPDPTVMPPIR